MRGDEVFLRDILRLAEEIDFLIAGLQQDTFVRIDVMRCTALLKLIFIGEAANYVSKDLQERHPSVE